jgi:transposase
MSASAQADYLNAVVEIETGLKCMRCLTGCSIELQAGREAAPQCALHTGPGFIAVWRAHRLGLVVENATKHAPARFCTAPLAEDCAWIRSRLARSGFGQAPGHRAGGLMTA